MRSINIDNYYAETKREASVLFSRCIQIGKVVIAVLRVSQFRNQASVCLLVFIILTGMKRRKGARRSAIITVLLDIWYGKDQDCEQMMR